MSHCIFIYFDVVNKGVLIHGEIKYHYQETKLCFPENREIKVIIITKLSHNHEI